MKKHILILVLFVSSLSNFAQVPFAVGDQAPDFTVTDYHGNVHHLYSYCSQGKYVLIDFFTYWCTACLETSPVIDEFYHKYGCNTGNVIVLGNESDPNGTNTQLFSFISQSGGDKEDTYPQWAGSNGGSTIASLYIIMQYPTIMLIGPDSTFLAVKIFPLPNITTLENKFPPGTLTPLNCNLAVDEIPGQPNTLIYPNPANSDVFVDINLERHGNFMIRIEDITGRNVLRYDCLLDAGKQKIRLDVQGLSTGIYMVNAYLNDQVFLNSKLSVQR